MVVKDGVMVTIGNTQYLQPDYYSPLPTTLDAKNSPLALLAQTCSQIGADNNNTAVKSILSATDKGKQLAKAEQSKSPSAAQKLILDMNRKSMSPPNKSCSPINTSGSNSSSSSSITNKGNSHNLDNNNNNNNNNSGEVKLAFKPYELNVLTGKVGKKCKSDNGGGHENGSDKCESPSGQSSGHDSERKCSSNRSSDGNKTPSSSSFTNPSQVSNGHNSSGSPIIRSGMDMLQNDVNFNGYKLPQLSPYSALNPLCCPPGMDPQEFLMNPAFRPPIGTGYPSMTSAHHHHAALLAAQGFPGLGSGYFGAYGAMKSPTENGVCKDPNCTGCQYSASAQHHHQQMMLGVPCPPGCVHCQTQKYNMAMAAIQSTYQMTAAQQRPLVCNWINGDSYCGKKFNSGEELLQHLKTHTAGLADPTAAAAALLQAQMQQQHHSNQMAHSSLFSTPVSSASMGHRGYRTPPLSPLSALRYHPYAGKQNTSPGAPSMPSAMQMPPYSSFNPAMFSPYYSPYAFYGQRLGGSAAVHP